MHIYQLTIYCFASFQIDRKLVKQTVMTSVYGVTYVGAREQIKRRLEEKGLITDDRLLFTAACYAAKVSNQRHQNSLIYYGTEISCICCIIWISRNIQTCKFNAWLTNLVCLIYR